eukprot:2735182-Prymnesium_polylepis.1
MARTCERYIAATRVRHTTATPRVGKLPQSCTRERRGGRARVYRIKRGLVRLLGVLEADERARLLDPH